MGKLLEALKQAEQARGMPGYSASVFPVVAAERDENRGDASSEVPYIEVGGPGMAMEGSALVLAEPPGVDLPKRKAREASSRQCIELQEPTSLTDLAPGSLVFQPLPLPRAVRRDRLSRELVTFHDPENPLSEEYRALAKAIAGQLPAEGSRVLLITAPQDGNGSSAVLLNLAITWARQERSRIAVVDAAMPNPTLASFLGLPSSPGLCEVAAGNLTVQRALQETDQVDLIALTAGDINLKTATRSKESIRDVIRQLRRWFDFILVDAPCWLTQPDIRDLVSACDAIYLVIRHAQATSPQTQALLQEIPHQGGRLLGKILIHP